MFEIVDDDDDGRMPDHGYTIGSSTSLRLRRAKNIYINTCSYILYSTFINDKCQIVILRFPFSLQKKEKTKIHKNDKKEDENCFLILTYLFLKTASQRYTRVFISVRVQICKINLYKYISQ